MNRIKSTLVGLLALLAVSPAFPQVPNFPQTLPASTVVGRTGIGSGPSQAIPFATLLSQIAAVPTSRTISTTAPITGGGALTANLTLGVTAAALTSASDTNVIVTLGGTPASALLAASSITMSWAGQLSIARGGTGQATQQAGFEALAPTPTRAGDIMYWNGTHYVTLPGNNSGTLTLQENASGVPVWASVAGTGTVTSVTCGTGLSGGTFTTVGTCAVQLTTATNSIGADVLLNNTGTYFDGPSMAQGTSGTWFASGSVTVVDTVTASSSIFCKLWDGTTVISSGVANNTTAGNRAVMSLSGILASPAANIRISCEDSSSTNGKIIFNFTGNSKDSTISGIRIQ